MGENLSVYLEDCTQFQALPSHTQDLTQDLTQGHTHELDIISEVDPANLNHQPTKHIKVAELIDGGYKVFAPLGRGAKGVSSAQFMFQIETRDDGYPHECLFIPYDRKKGRAARYRAEIHDGGRPPHLTMLIFSANGNEIIEEQPGRPNKTYHRVSQPQLIPAA